MLDEGAKQLSGKIKEGMERAQEFIGLTAQQIKDIMDVVESKLEDYQVKLW
jgi:chemotaxis regulatin CheY-phosphate phosphatase CheZ